MNNNNYEYIYPGTNITIQDIQKIELEMLIEFDRICRKYEIPYQLFAGTLLGVIRHKGFIPWDDDIDIAMRRSDYNEFIEACKTELDSKYFLQTCFTDPDSVIQFAKIRKNGTIYENSVDNLASTNTGIWIDIFPFDNVLEECLRAKIQRLQIQILYALETSSVHNRVVLSPKLWKRIIRRFFSILIKFYGKKCVDEKLLKIFTKYNKIKTKYVSHLTMGAIKSAYLSHMQLSENFTNLIEMEFCGKLFFVPRNYHEILQKLYGDYMTLPPEEKRKPTHGIENVKL